MAFATSRTQNNGFQSTSRANQDMDKIITGDVECDSLAVSGNVTLGDDDFIQFGAGNDMSIGHDPDRNFINHSKQLQFKSTMTSGDGYKFLETGQRQSKFLFASNNNGGTEKSNYYFTIGNDDTGVTDRSYMHERIRRRDGTGLHTIIEKSQVGDTVDTAVVDTKCKAIFSNDLTIVDGKSLFVGNSGDFQIQHTGSTTYIDEQGSGNLYIRTNGTQIAISDTSSSTNYMARFIKDSSVELYHNKVKKFETSASGITVTGAVENNFETITTPGAGFADAVVGSNISKINNEIVTTILIDLQQGPIAAESTGLTIGKNGSSADAYITRVTTAKNGVIFKAEMSCIELPNASKDIDLVFSNSGSLGPGENPGGVFTAINAGVAAVGNTVTLTHTATNGLTDQYLYLASGSVDGTANYTAGKFILKLFGTNF